MAASRGARRLFTSINGANFASQASFEKAGFETFAIYDGKSKSIVATDSARFGIFENKVMIKEGTERIAL